MQLIFLDDKPIVTPTEKLAKRKGIKYIPFYTSPCLEKEIRSQVDFSKKEMDLFAKRYEEGYDLFDERYDIWLQKFHPADDMVCKALFGEESEKCFEEVTSREQTMYTEETFGWEEPTTSREVSASDRVNNRKEVTRREEPNTLNNKEVCKVSSDI